jgi:outer membrane protein
MFRLELKKNFIFILPFIISVMLITYADTKAQSLSVSLANAYSNHPLLFSERIGERVLSEDVAEALSGWKPQVYVDGSLGKTLVTTKTNTSSKTNSNLPMSMGIVVSKKIYDGGKTSQNIKIADTKLIANGSRLTAIENQVLLSAVKAYFNLLKEQDLLDVAVKNKDVIQRQLEATKDRFDVGDLTITDVSQAEARLSDANANLVRAEADLNSAKAIFFSDIGLEPVDVFYPEEIPVLPQNLQILVDDVKKLNPKVINARKMKLVYEEELKLSLKEMSLSVDIQASANQAWEPNTFFEEQRYFDVSANLKMPLYKGGKDKAIIRKSREKLNKANSEIDDILRQEAEKAMLIWNNIESLNSQITAFKSSIRANEIALDGVVQEENVGARTVIDVLDAENELFMARANLIRANTSHYIATYELLEVTGRMTARDLNLPVSSFYDTNEYYNNMKNLSGENGTSLFNFLDKN